MSRDAVNLPGSGRGDGARPRVRYRAIVAYDGTAFEGFQAQERRGGHARTVQTTLEGAVSSIVGEDVRVVCAGRTDTGVHASGQVAHFDLTSGRLPALHKTPRAINARLPEDVRVIAVDAAPAGFHARHSARSRTYRYVIVNCAVALPHLRLHAWNVRSQLDVDAMRAGACHLVGTHDFRAFAAHEGPGPTIRQVRRVSVRVAGGDDERVPPDAYDGTWHTSLSARPGMPSCGRIVTVEVEANAFLRHMMRRIVGTLVRVGLGSMSSYQVSEVLHKCDKAGAGPTAPPHGLDLVHVSYDEAIPIAGACVRRAESDDE